MRAILRTGFGGPEVLVIREIPEPEPKDGHAVIEVNPTRLGPMVGRVAAPPDVAMSDRPR